MIIRNVHVIRDNGKSLKHSDHEIHAKFSITTVLEKLFKPEPDEQVVVHDNITNELICEMRLLQCGVTRISINVDYV